MIINEIFYSLQGEGKWMGLPNIFIRTTGCNLRCSFCDTIYAYNSGKKMSIEEIMKDIRNYPSKYICITGGEPLLQNDTLFLIDVLLENDYIICLETNGSLNIENIAGKKSLMISLDIKCPSSNMHDKMCLENISYLGKDDQLKFVIGTIKDYNYAKKIVQDYIPICSVFFQSIWGKDPKQLASWLLNDGLNVNLGLQFHKILWGNRGKI
jgi:7-carboxy-7-deazaguanine synthase